MEVAQGFSEVLRLQQLLGQGGLVELLDGFSEAEWNVQASDTNTPEGSTACKTDIDQYIPYFCGTLRKRASSVLHAIIDRSCNGDSYRKGWLLC